MRGYELTINHIYCIVFFVTNTRFRGVNSVVECYLHTVEVTGSNPVLPIVFFVFFLIEKIFHITIDEFQSSLFRD